METTEKKYSVAKLTEGFRYDENSRKGVHGLGGKLVIQPEFQRNYLL